MTTPLSFSSSSVPEEDYTTQISTQFQGEDLEIIISDSEDQLRPSPPPKRGKKKKKRKPSEFSSSSPRTRLFPSSVTMADRFLGRMAPKQQLFCPYQAVSKYPYRYLRKNESEEVSKAYFAGGKLRARGWSIYYLHTGLTSVKPLLFVPAIEFRALLAEINGNLNLKLKVPDDSGFMVSFLENGIPRPRYLGCLSAENSLEDMESLIPGPDFKVDGEDEVDPRSFEAFKQKMEALIEATKKSRSKSSKEKRKKARVLEKKNCCLQLRRTQRYLGMKPLLIDPVSEVLEWRALEEASKKHEEAIAQSLQPIDMTKPVPYPFEQEVIFIAIDVEWYERSHKAITEIGISVLDTADLRNIAPGEGCLAWMDQIRARHFRIKEHSHLVNTDFVAGCADRFEAAFGTSEWVSLEDAPKAVASCFRFDTASGADAPDDGPAEEQNGYDDGPSHSSSLASISGLEHENDDGVKPKRNIILVGHDVKTDVDHLRAMGFDLSNLSNILEVIDTADMFRALKHEQQPRSLGAILLDLGLTGWNLHNAGNDAAYTLQAMLGISLKALDVSRERRAAIAAARAIRIEEAAEEAQQHVREDLDEWDMVDVENADADADADADAEASAAVNIESGKSINAVTGRAKVGAKQTTEEKVNENNIEETEAQRIVLAAGDDIGDDEATIDDTIVQKRVSKAKDDLVRSDHQIGSTTDRSLNISNRNSFAGSMNWGENGSGSGDVGVRNVEKSSPLSAEILARLNFLDEEDLEEGGVKL